MGEFAVFSDNNFVDLTLIQYGWEQCRPLHSWGPSVRNNYLFHFILSGTGYVEYNYLGESIRKQRLSANSGFLICPGDIVTYYADESDPWKYAWVEFNGIQASFCLKLAGLSHDEPIYRSKSPEDAVQIANEILHIANHPKASQTNLLGHLYLFFDALENGSINQQKLRHQSQDNYYICEAMTYVERYYMNEVTVSDIAKFCGLSRTHFGRLFKKMTGQSPLHYLTIFRLTKAIELMRTTDLSMGEIAVRVGYSNQLYFSKVFRKEYGVSPRTWRQQDRLVLKQLSKKHEKGR